MHFLNDNGRPALRIVGRDEFGQSQPVVHVLDFDTAYRLQAELDLVISELRREGEVKLTFPQKLGIDPVKT